MKINAYAVFDEVAQTHATPFFAPNDEVAKRHFRFSLKNLDEIFISDFVLWRVGDFDIENGVFSNSFYVIDSGKNVLSDREIEEENSEVKQL